MIWKYLERRAQIYVENKLLAFLDMKQILLFTLLLLCTAKSSAQLNESFSDGNFTNNPTWLGDLSNFLVNSENTLQLDVSSADTSVLYTAVEMPDSTVWEMDFKLNFAPSGSNRLRIYLQTNIADFENADGYFLEIGETGSDDALRLYRSDGGNRTLITSATEGALGSNPAMAKLKITRSKTGNWTIFANYENEPALNLEATVFDDTYLGGDLFFGFWCKNTSSNGQGFEFDNIIITSFLPDVSAPNLVSIIPSSLTELELNFDEPLDSLTAVTTANFLINNGIGNPSTATWSSDAQSKIFLTLATPLNNQTTYEMGVNNVEDPAGNILNNNTFTFEVNFVAPQILSIEVLSNTELELEFDSPVNITTASLSTNYTVNQNIGNPVNAEVDAVDDFRVYLQFATAFENNTSYLLNVANVQNLLGITMIPQDISFDFLIPETILPGDLVLNEILFDPKTGGSDFVEIYNNSDKFLDVADLIIANTQRTTSISKEVETSFILKPGEYLVFSADPEDILADYEVERPEYLIENPLPGFNIAGGNVSLFTNYGADVVVIDSFDYLEDFHYPLLDNTKGISLERISFDAPTEGRDNWHSAATSAGGATPTIQNSQQRTTTVAEEIFTITESVFSPDNDGFRDFLLLDYSLETQGYLATVHIYDARGRLIKTLAENELLAIEGTLKWDGITDEGRKARLGIYVILAEIFTPTKEAQQFKQTCVVAGNLD